MRVSFYNICVGSLLPAVIVSTFAARLSPVIYVPGTVSILNVKVDGQEFDPKCPKTGEFDISLTHQDAPSTDQPFSPACMNKMLELEVDPKAGEFGSYQNKAGVTVSLYRQGTLDCIVPKFQLDVRKVFKKAGYEIGNNMHVLCYDWRMAPDTAVGHDKTPVAQLEELLQATYREHGAPVWLVAASMGGLIVNKLLRTLEDKDMIAGFIALAPITIGTAMTVNTLFAGMDVTAMQPDPSLAYVRHTWPATYALMPDVHAYKKEIAFITDTATDKKYTGNDFGKLFSEAGWKLGDKLWRRFNGEYAAYKFSPGVHVWAFYGKGDRTPISWQVSGLTHQVPVTTQFTDGDMMLDAYSRADMMTWQERNAGNRHHFELKAYDLVDHYQVPLHAWPRVVKVLKGKWENNAPKHDEL